MKVVIAGASGFIGRNLLESLDENIDVLGLSRSKPKIKKDHAWRQTDLFSLKDTTEALVGADIAVFLVHSMLPSTRLFQGDFQDTDLILADNFARACVKNKVKKIIYLGGVVPEGTISSHLQSRKEVEDIFIATGIDCHMVRSGMIVGNGGSSYEILKNLCLNLPMMVLPKWSKSITKIIYIDDLTRIMNYLILNHHNEQIINAVTKEEITYKELLIKTLNYLDKKIPIISVPINYLKLSKLWVSTFGKANIELVSPIVDSLLCDISKAQINPSIEKYIKYKTYDDMLKKINKEPILVKKRSISTNIQNVRSIQRIATNKYIDIEKIVQYYFLWLPKHVKSFIVIDETETDIIFKVAILNIKLLHLRYIQCDNHDNRVKFHIIGGLLTKTTNTGWLEFRNISDGKYLIASINEFQPSLPWFLYKRTQAIMHENVMNNFKKDVNKLNYLTNTFHS